MAKSVRDNGGSVHHWTSAEDIVQWRKNAVVKTIEAWVTCPFAAPPSDGRGSTPVMLDTVEVMDGPDDPCFH